MTSHELAQKLLEQPNKEVVICVGDMYTTIDEIYNITGEDLDFDSRMVIEVEDEDELIELA